MKGTRQSQLLFGQVGVVVASPRGIVWSGHDVLVDSSRRKRVRLGLTAQDGRERRR
jgi:hypothetical protein